MSADVCSPSIEKSPSIHAHSPPNPTIVALQRIFRGVFVGMLFGHRRSSCHAAIVVVALDDVLCVVCCVWWLRAARRQRAPTPPQTDYGRTRC